MQIGIIPTGLSGQPRAPPYVRSMTLDLLQASLTAHPTEFYGFQLAKKEGHAHCQVASTDVMTKKSWSSRPSTLDDLPHVPSFTWSDVEICKALENMAASWL